MNWFMIIIWLLMILGGIWFYLLVYDVIKPFKDDEEKGKIWHKKFDKLFKIGAPIIIICSLFLIIYEILGS